jgi:UDP-GlcNAc:undecaprenyl-phosphate GlcNAc-1-phosphate transferase
MGGVGIYLALLISAGLVHFCSGLWLGDNRETRFNILVLLVSGGLFCTLGLIDDRWPMRARKKLLWQIVASLPFAIWGRSIDAVDFMGLHIQLGIWSVPFTVFWLVAFANVINLIDGLDGLAGSIGLVVSLTIAALAGISGQYGVCLLSLLFAGSLVGFLIHNWPPAKIFLGDSGSLTVGFLIGALSIESLLKEAMGFTLIVPLVLISIPMFDTSMAILRRKLSGRSIGYADRAHIHHCLQDRGLTRVQSLLILTGLCSVMALVAVASVCLDSDLVAVGLCASILGLLIAGRIFGHHEIILLFQHLRALGVAVIGTSHLLPARWTAAPFPLPLQDLEAEDGRSKEADSWTEAILPFPENAQHREHGVRKAA